MHRFAAFALVGAAMLAIAAGWADGAAAQDLTPDPWSDAQMLELDLKAAADGYVDAEIALARRYEAGQGVTKDPARAVEFWGAASRAGRPEAIAGLRRLAQGGDVRAQMFLGRALYRSADARARREGLDWLEKAGDAGSADANFILASYLAPVGDRLATLQAKARFGRAEDAEPRLAALARVLRLEIGRAQARKAWTPAPGAPVRGDAVWSPRLGEGWNSRKFWGWTEKQTYSPELLQKLAVGRRLFEVAEAAWAGDPVARVLLRWELSRRCVGTRTMDVDACAAYADQPPPALPAEFQDLKSDALTDQRMLAAARLFELGVGAPADYAKARWFYTTLAERSRDDKLVGEAAFRLWRLNDAGLGGPKDPAKAAKWLARAQVAGHPTAAYTQAMELIRKRDFQNAAGRLRDAADGGNVDAAYRYAELLRAGWATAPSGPSDIFKYYQKGASSGDVHSAHGLAWAYWKGWGVTPDAAKAQTWWEIAARAGEPSAAWELAMRRLEAGDPPGAIPWLRRAAQGGHPKAQAALQDVLSKGYRERSLGGFLMTMLEMGGEVLEGMAEAQQYQIEMENARIRQAMMAYVPVSSSSSPSAASSSDSGAGSADGAGADVGDAGGAFGGGDAGGAGYGGFGSGGAGSGGASSGGGWPGAGASADSGGAGGGGGSGDLGSGAGGADGGFAGSNGGGGSSDSGSGGGASGDAGGYGGSGGGGGDQGAIIVEDLSAKQAAWQAEQDRLWAEVRARDEKMRADIAQSKADNEAAAQREWEAGAAERARTRAVCEAARREGASCVSPQ